MYGRMQTRRGEAGSVSGLMIATGVLLAVAAAVTLVIAVVQGLWIVAAAMAVCAVSVGVQVWDA